MALMSSHLAIGIALTLTFVQNCLCGGTIQVTLIEYEPRKWKEKNEEECAEREECGVFFQIKFYEEANGRWRGDLWPMLTTKNFRLNKEEGLVKFGKQLTSTEKNPLRKSFTSGTFGLRIFVVESGSDAPFEEFNTVFSIVEFPFNVQRDHSFYSVNYPYSSITMRILVRCNKFYFGPICAVHCQPQNSTELGHFNCTTKGEKICFKNWRNSSKNCTEPDLCASHPCRNNGTCSQISPKDYRCSCPSEFTGQDCELKKLACDLKNPCHNDGTCHTFNETHSQCNCTGGWTGSVCELDLDECVERPCGHGGRCQNRLGGQGFECNCSGTGYRGRRCTEDLNECSESTPVCQSNCTCKNTIGSFRCLCQDEDLGWRFNSTLDPQPSFPNSKKRSDLSFWIALGIVILVICFGLVGPTICFLVQHRKGLRRMSNIRKATTLDTESMLTTLSVPRSEAANGANGFCEQLQPTVHGDDNEDEGAESKSPLLKEQTHPLPTEPLGGHEGNREGELTDPLYTHGETHC